MVQVLCLAGRGFDARWRPRNIAFNPLVYMTAADRAEYTPIRFHR